MKETMSPDSTNTVLKLEPATKRCWKCETTRAVADFSKDKSRPDGLQPICRECAKDTREARKVTHSGEQRRSWAKWYANPENKAKTTARTVAYNRRRADTLVERFKSAPCMDCHQTLPSACMEFDHRPGTEKCFILNTKGLRSHSLESVMDEIAKCDLVCANCHRVRTVARNQMGRKG